MKNFKKFHDLALKFKTLQSAGYVRRLPNVLIPKKTQSLISLAFDQRENQVMSGRKVRKET